MRRKRRQKAEKNGSGVMIQKAIGVRIKNPVQVKYFLWIFELLLIYLASISILFCYITAMKFPVNTRTLLIAGGIFSVLFFCISVWEKYIYTTIPLVFLTGALVLYDNYRLIANGIYLCENNFINALNKYYNTSYVRYVVGEYDEKISGTFFMLFILLLICCIVTYLVSVAKGKILYLVGSLIFLVLPAICGLVPAGWALSLYAVASCGIFGVMSVQKRVTKDLGIHLVQGQSRYGKSVGLSIGFMSCLVVAALLIASNYLISNDQYESWMKEKDLKHNIQSWFDGWEKEASSGDSFIQKIQNSFPSNGGGDKSGGLGEGKLNTSKSGITYQHTPQLLLSIPSISRPLYIKGYNGIHYSGSSWDGLTQKEEMLNQKKLNQLYQSGFSPDLSIVQVYEELLRNGEPMEEYFPYTISEAQMVYANANSKFLYYPYFTSFWKNTNQAFFDRIEGDYKESYIEPKSNQLNYDFPYYDYGFALEKALGIGRLSREAVLSEKLQKNLSDYSDFVYEIYLQLPKSQCRRLIQETEQQSELLKVTDRKKYLTNRNGMDVSKCVNYVKDYLNRNTDYTLTPGALPNGKDFIEYFVYENKKGYCAHYASAATVMLRALGIPARYVEGYCVSVGYFDSYASNKEKNHTIVETVEGPNQSTKKKQQSYMLTVDDSCAHAWVEIYIDGAGWYPVDFTKSSSTSQASAANQDPQNNFSVAGGEKPKEKPSKPEEPAKAEEEKKKEQEKEKAEAEKEKPAQESPSPDKNQKNPAPAENQTQEKIDNQEKVLTHKSSPTFRALLKLLKAVGILLLVILLLGGIEWLRRRRILTKLKKLTKREQIVLLSQQVEKELWTAGYQGTLEELESIMVHKGREGWLDSQTIDETQREYLRARYSRHEYTREEFAAAWKQIYVLHERILNKKSKIKRCWSQKLHHGLLEISKNLN